MDTLIEYNSTATNSWTNVELKLDTNSKRSKQHKWTAATEK